MKSQNKTNNYHPVKLLFSLILILSFSTIVLTQTKVSKEKSKVIVTDKVMKQVVRKVLIRYFKPRNQKKTIYLSEKRLKQSWLPKIKGINFQLLFSQEDENRLHYFFTDLEKISTGKYRIGFAYGCMPGCGYTGNFLYFRIWKKGIRLWESNEGFGSSGVDHGPDYYEIPPIMKKPN